MNERKNNIHDTLLKLCFSGMFAALICVATMLIQIPVPLCGYLNFGDCFILIAAWTVGPYYGFAAGAIGSALADILSGYSAYVPGTFVIKGLIALTAALIFHALARKNDKLRIPGLFLGAFAGEAVMVAGYYLYDAAIMGYGFAATLLEAVPQNLIQGACGIVFGLILMPLILKTGVKKIFPVYSAR